jgi:hypothetical protein
MFHNALGKEFLENSNIANSTISLSRKNALSDISSV